MPLTELLRPAAEHLPEYAAALRRGFEPSTYSGPATARRHLDAMCEDAEAFLASLDDPAALGPPVVLPDGSTKPRLPGFTRWIWSNGFCGVVNFRWQPGTAALPAHVLGHAGYLVAAWRRGEGHATRALSLLLRQVNGLGLPWIELTTEPENHASIKVIEANGGVLVERFQKLVSHGGGPGLRFRIALPAPSSPG